jgi:hypothetical protein
MHNAADLDDLLGQARAATRAKLQSSSAAPATEPIGEDNLPSLRLRSAAFKTDNTSSSSNSSSNQIATKPRSSLPGMFGQSQAFSHRSNANATMDLGFDMEMLSPDFRIVNVPPATQFYQSALNEEEAGPPAYYSEDSWRIKDVSTDANDAIKIVPHCINMPESTNSSKLKSRSWYQQAKDKCQHNRPSTLSTVLSVLLLVFVATSLALYTSPTSTITLANLQAQSNADQRVLHLLSAVCADSLLEVELERGSSSSKIQTVTVLGHTLRISQVLDSHGQYHVTCLDPANPSLVHESTGLDPLAIKVELCSAVLADYF